MLAVPISFALGVGVVYGGRHEGRGSEIIDVSEFIGKKGFRAKGKRVSYYDVARVGFMPEPEEELEEETMVPAELEEEAVNEPAGEKSTGVEKDGGKRESIVADNGRINIDEPVLFDDDTLTLF